MLLRRRTVYYAVNKYAWVVSDAILRPASIVYHRFVVIKTYFLLHPEKLDCF